MNEGERAPEHWAGEPTSYRPSREAREMWALVYDATPGGVRNEDGTTTYSARIPALIISEYVANPEKTAAELSAKMNAFPALVEALQGVVDWCDFAMACPREFDSHGVRNLDGPAFDKARAALAKVKGAAS